MEGQLFGLYLLMCFLRVMYNMQTDVHFLEQVDSQPKKVSLHGFPVTKLWFCRQHLRSRKASTSTSWKVRVSDPVWKIAKQGETHWHSQGPYSRNRANMTEQLITLPRSNPFQVPSSKFISSWGSTIEQTANVKHIFLGPLRLLDYEMCWPTACPWRSSGCGGRADHQRGLQVWHRLYPQVQVAPADFGHGKLRDTWEFA